MAQPSLRVVPIVMHGLLNQSIIRHRADEIWMVNMLNSIFVFAFKFTICFSYDPGDYTLSSQFMYLSALLS